MHVELTAADEQDWIRQALACEVREAQWRVWRYRAPAIVLGCSQRRLHTAVAQRAGAALPVFVRGSGGGAVLVGPWLIGTTILLPLHHRLAQGALVDSYRWLGELHVRVLRDFEVESQLLPPWSLHDGDLGPVGTTPLSWACFGALSPWEIVDAQGRKLCGLAQQRRAAGIALVSGILVYRPPWEVLCSALDRDADLAALVQRTTDCATLASASAGAMARPDAQHAGFASALAAEIDSALAQVF